MSSQYLSKYVKDFGNIAEGVRDFMLVFDSLVQCMVHVVVSDAHIVCLLVTTRWLPLQSLGPVC